MIIFSLIVQKMQDLKQPDIVLNDFLGLRQNCFVAKVLPFR